MRLIRSDNIELLIIARKCLLELGDIAPKSTKFKDSKGGNIYTSSECEALGKNYMSESSRLRGIEGYTFYIRYYALQGLYDIISTTFVNEGNLRNINFSNQKGWASRRDIFLSDFKGQTSIIDLMSTYIKMLNKIYHSIIDCKNKDVKRGRLIIDDYDHGHSSSVEDAVVIQMHKYFKNVVKMVDSFSPNLASDLNNSLWFVKSGM
jgi:hypothetical protein